ncbi:MAG: hypothetical protein ABI591_16570 [Kofleriaceae bacterium]
MNLAGHDEHYLHAMWTVVSVLGILVAVGLAVLYRRARRRAETEEIERLLAEDDARPGHVTERHG